MSQMTLKEVEDKKIKLMETLCLPKTEGDIHHNHLEFSQGSY